MLFHWIFHTAAARTWRGFPFLLGSTTGIFICSFVGFTSIAVVLKVCLASAGITLMGVSVYAAFLLVGWEALIMAAQLYFCHFSHVSFWQRVPSGGSFLPVSTLFLNIDHLSAVLVAWLKQKSHSKSDRALFKHQINVWDESGETNEHEFKGERKQSFIIRLIGTPPSL